MKLIGVVFVVFSFRSDSVAFRFRRRQSLRFVTKRLVFVFVFWRKVEVEPIGVAIAAVTLEATLGQLPGAKQGGGAKTKGVEGLEGLEH